MIRVQGYSRQRSYTRTCDEDAGRKIYTGVGAGTKPIGYWGGKYRGS
jgi:hypothetical protein